MNPNLRILIALLSMMILAGCTAQASMPVRQLSAISDSGFDDLIGVEVEGYAYKNTDETLGEVRQRAKDKALTRAIVRGARAYVDTYYRVELGSFTDEMVENAVASVLTDIQLLDEGARESSYWLKLMVYFRPEDVDVVLASKHASDLLRIDDSIVETPTTIRPSVVEPSLAISNVTVCCSQLPETLVSRVYPVLVEAPGVGRVQKTWNARGKLCYRVEYDRPKSELERWLFQHLPTTKVASLRRVENRDRYIIRLTHDGGFD